jgi:hypothetical protein
VSTELIFAHISAYKYTGKVVSPLGGIQEYKFKENVHGPFGINGTPGFPAGVRNCPSKYGDVPTVPSIQE